MSTERQTHWSARPITKEEEHYILAKYHTTSAKDMAKALGRTNKTIYDYLEQNGLFEKVYRQQPARRCYRTGKDGDKVFRHDGKNPITGF